MKWIFLLIITCQLMACDLLEINEVEFIDTYITEEILYVFNIENDSLLDYEIFQNEELINSISFERVDAESINEVNRNSNNVILRKRLFSFISDTLIKSTVDSMYTKDDTIVYLTSYTYANGYLSQTNREFIDGNVIPDSINVRTRIRYDDGNMMAMDVIVNNKYCINRYEYTDYPDLFDIDNKANGWFGEGNQYLRKATKWQASCFKEDFVTIPATSLKYEFDLDGRVIKRTETYTPSYHTSLDSVVERKIRIERFEYSEK